MRIANQSGKENIMQTAQSKARPKRKATNLSVRVDLLQIAREDNLNLSGMLENSLLDYCKKKREKDWVEENKAGIDAYNDRIDRNGVFASKHRRF
jgi:antitoxin CcdA